MKYLIAIIAVAAAVFGFWQWNENRGSEQPENVSVDTDETADSKELVLGLGEVGTALGLRITANRLLEDSRCPQDVTCVWAGTVRVETLIVSAMGTSTNAMEPGSAITTEAEEVTFVGAEPYPLQAGEPIAPEDYRFIFRIAKRLPMEGT